MHLSIPDISVERISQKVDQQWGEQADCHIIIKGFFEVSQKQVCETSGDSASGTVQLCKDMKKAGNRNSGSLIPYEI